MGDREHRENQLPCKLKIKVIHAKEGKKWLGLFLFASWREVLLTFL